MITRSCEQERTQKVHMRGGNGTAELRALSAALPGCLRLFSRIELAPGCSIGYHVHENETEMFYFASGSGRVCDDGTWFDVSAGDAMTTPSGHGHAVENTGSEPLVLVACIAKD